MNENASPDSLAEFGRFVVEELRDSILNRYLDVETGHLSGPPDDSTKN